MNEFFLIHDSDPDVRITIASSLVLKFDIQIIVSGRKLLTAVATSGAKIHMVHWICGSCQELTDVARKKRNIGWIGTAPSFVRLGSEILR